MRIRLLIILGIIITISVSSLIIIDNIEDQSKFPPLRNDPNAPDELRVILQLCEKPWEDRGLNQQYRNQTHHLDTHNCVWKYNFDKIDWSNSPTKKFEETDLRLVLHGCSSWIESKNGREPLTYSNETHFINTKNCEWELEHEKSTPRDIASIEDGHIILYPVDTCAGIDINRLTLDELNQRYPATFTTKSGKTYEIKFLSINDDDLKEMPIISELISATHQIPFPLNGGITASKGLVENPDWNDYREWYDQKKTEQFNLDEVRVRGFVYNEGYYGIGFPIC